MVFDVLGLADKWTSVDADDLEARVSVESAREEAAESP